MQVVGVQKPRWGIHMLTESLSNVKLLKKAISSGFTCYQMFFGNPKEYTRRRFTDEEALEFRKLTYQHNISFNTHFPYYLNLCEKESKAVPVLQEEINQVGKAGGRVVAHTGTCKWCKHSNREIKAMIDNTNIDPEDNTGFERNRKYVQDWTTSWKIGADQLIVHVLNLKFPPEREDPVLLLEPPAGEGNKLGWDLSQIAYIFEKMPKNVGFCLDTCHAFAAGVCKFNTIEVVEKFFSDLAVAVGGWHRIKLIHLNDSKDEFGAMKDRHASLGTGKIWSEPDNIEGLAAIWAIAAERDIDIVSEEGDKVDIDMMKILAASLNSTSE